jgi:hypothetical protein
VVFSGYSGISTNKTDIHDITEILLKVALTRPILIKSTPHGLVPEYGPITGHVKESDKNNDH